jgi:hypothetical protein
MAKLIPLFLAVSLSSVAQNELYIDGAVITIQNGALVYVDGDITITNSGTVTNEGDIHLTGNWTNNVSGGLTYSGGSTNTIHFVGSGTQVIGGSQSTTFNNLTLNGPTSVRIDVNTTAGGTGSGTLALNASELNLNALTMTVTNATTGAITRTSGYVLSESVSPNYGYLSWQIGTSSVGTYTVPFGTAGGTAYIPFIFTITSPGNASTGAVAAATYPTDASASPNNSPWPSGTPAMTDASLNPLWSKIADRFWNVNLNNYTTRPTLTYAFTYQDASPNDLLGTNNLTETNLQAIYYGGPGSPSAWAPWPLGSDDPTNNRVTGVTNVDFSAPWLLLDPQGLILPVTLLEFDAEPVENTYIHVFWNTAVEVDNRGFELQRSTDRVNFEPISWIPGNGTTSGVSGYAYDDADVVRNVIYYYRLKQISYAGDVTYSNIESASLTGESHLLIGEFYPNPTLDLSSIDIFSPDAATMRIEIFDGLGRLVKSGPAYIASGNNTVNVNLAEVAHGTYTVKLSIGGSAYPKRIVKLR